MNSIWSSACSRVGFSSVVWCRFGGGSGPCPLPLRGGGVLHGWCGSFLLAGGGCGLGWWFRVDPAAASLDAAGVTGLMGIGVVPEPWCWTWRTLASTRTGMTIIWRLPPSLKRRGFNGSCTPICTQAKADGLEQILPVDVHRGGITADRDAGHLDFGGPLLVLVEAAQVEPAR